MDFKSSYPSSEDDQAPCDSACDLNSGNDLAHHYPRELRFTFRLGWRWVTACGTPCDHHPNIIFLRICPGMLDYLFLLLNLFLPTIWRDWLESKHPEFFLPPKVVMKREKVDWAEEFDNERDIYKALAPIQGTVVPRFYGEVKCPTAKGAATRALIMSDVGGIQLNEVQGLDIAHLEAMLSQSIRALTYLKVGHGDPKLDNFMLVGDKIMVIDFDSAYILDQEDPESEANLDVSHIMWIYQRIDWD